MELKLVPIENPDELNLILGQSHFIKTVEDLAEVMVNGQAALRFGLAFCEASGPCLIRHDGNDEELERFMHLAHIPEFLSALEPIDGAVEALNELAVLDYEIAVVTGRPPWTAEVSRAWLDRHRVPYDRLAFVDKYGRGGFGASNSSVITLDELTQSSFIFAVEDSSDMAALLTTEMEVPVALLERPWNREAQFSDPRSVALIERCADWAAIVERFSSQRGI